MRRKLPMASFIHRYTPDFTTPKWVKSWKREVSLVLMGYLMYLGYLRHTDELEILVWPFMFFAFGAFGLDAFNKQTIPKIENRRKPAKGENLE